MSSAPGQRLRVLYVNPRMSISGVDSRGYRAVPPGESLVIGCVTGGIRVKSDGPVELGGVRSYVVTADTEGALTFQHTGHAGTMHVNGEPAVRAELAASDVIDLLTPTGGIAMRLVCE